MRFLKLALLSFGFLFLLVTGISLFIPSHVRVSRAINILAAPDSIMALVKEPPRWKQWHPGLENASEFRVNGHTTGLVIDSQDKERPVTLVLKEAGKDKITAEFNPRKLRPVINTWQVIQHPGTDSVTLNWYLDFNLRWYPWEKFGSLLLEKSHGARMEQGLQKLKNLVQTDKRYEF